MQKIKTFLKSKVGILVIVALVIIISVLVFKGKSGASETVSISKGDFTKVVSVSGKVIAVNNVDLSFETGGTVAAVYKNVGDKVRSGEMIAALNSSDLIAQRDVAEADLEGAKAELSRITNNESSSDVSINKEQAINAIADAYTTADDAVHNKVDQFFENPRTGPEIKYTFYDYFSTKTKINDSREQIETDLQNFGILANSLNVNNYSNQKLTDAKKYIQKVKMFLDIVAPAVNSFEESNVLTNSMISEYRADVALARSNINTTLSDLTTYEDKLRGSVSDISIQQAKVSSKEANVRTYDAQIAKTIIYAPFDGTLSLQDAKVGESVAAHTKVSALISSGLQVEVYIPEISIPGVNLGNKAKVTLDAYPDASFDAVVTHIDPAETLKDGVSNYKLELNFVTADPRIISGLTGDVTIETQKKSGIISVGERSIVTDADKYYVYLKTKDNPVKTEVNLGIKDGKGNVEVLSGLNEGDIILLNPPTN
ncbi:MAG: efflux RND transporter periplasmic adaptor subunit [Patescibacteria group bacterium]